MLRSAQRDSLRILPTLKGLLGCRPITLAAISYHGGEGRGFSPAVTKPADCRSLSPPAQLAAASWAGGEGIGEGTPAISAGLKPRPSGAAGQPPRVGKKSGLGVFLAVAVGLVFQLACGVQGPPQPPRVEVPERVADLSVFQVGRTLQIRFTLPQQAMDGERLTKPLEIELIRAHLPLGSQPPKPPLLAVWTTLQPDQWKRYTTDRKVTYPALLSEDEYKNWQADDSLIALRTLTRGFRQRPVESEISNLVRLKLLDVSGPIDHVDRQITEKAIELRWLPPAVTLAGKQVKFLAGYRIYRSLTGKPGSFQLLGEGKEPQYLDGDFEFGRAYTYEVRVLFKEGGAIAESESSPAYEVIARDTFPPARPTGLTALYTSNAVELVWTANSEKDLAGYYVYRRENGEQTTKLKKELLRTPLLRDASVQAGHTYFYQVTAVDLSNNESQPSEEVKVETGN